MDYSLPGSSVHGISQARILEWVEFSSRKKEIKKEREREREREREKERKKERKTIDKMAMRTYLSIFILYVNGLNTPTKIHKLAK